MILRITLLFYISILWMSCEKPDPTEISEFTIQEEIELGKKMENATIKDTTNFIVLSSADYPFAYNYLNSKIVTLLESGRIINVDNFLWRVQVIHNDELIASTAYPGGVIFVTTGLLQSIESEAQFLGWLSHEMAYAEKHLTKEFLASEYSLSVLLDVAIGTSAIEVTNDLVHTLWSEQMPREFVEIADRFAVTVTCDTYYNALGFSEFLRIMEMLQEKPNWLIQRPGTKQRINDSQLQVQTSNCSGEEINGEIYKDFLNKLPN